MVMNIPFESMTQQKQIKKIKSHVRIGMEVGSRIFLLFPLALIMNFPTWGQHYIGEWSLSKYLLLWLQNPPLDPRVSLALFGFNSCLVIFIHLNPQCHKDMVTLRFWSCGARIHLWPCSVTAFWAAFSVLTKSIH